MAVTQEPNKFEWVKKSFKNRMSSWFFWILGISVFIYCMKVISDATIWIFVKDAHIQGANLISRMFPPNWSSFGKLIRPIWDTINIATLGTSAAILVAFPLAFLASVNTSPNKFLRQAALLVIVTSRSVNSMIWALLIVAVIGPGVPAGIIAIALRSIGFVGKLLYEAIDEIDQKQVEAITALGASRLNILLFGIVPQILPAFWGTAIYRWDINIRESTVVGFVGAGGLGMQLNTAVLGMFWDDASVLFIVILVLVLIAEWVSSMVRKAIV